MAAPFASSISGYLVPVILVMIPLCFGAAGWFVARRIARSDRKAAIRELAAVERDRQLTGVIQDMRDMTKQVASMLETQHKHDTMIDKLTDVVTATNTTLTMHLEWAQTEYTLARGSKRPSGQE